MLNDKIALITGAAKGIGRTIALYFAKHGCHIAFTDICRDENVDTLINEIEGLL